MTRLQEMIYEKAAKTIGFHDFKARYKHYLKQGLPKPEAYEATEKDHVEVTGKRRYAKYHWFSAALSKNKKVGVIRD
jgi:hypothetical protein